MTRIQQVMALGEKLGVTEDQDLNEFMTAFATALTINSANEDVFSKTLAELEKGLS